MGFRTKEKKDVMSDFAARPIDPNGLGNLGDFEIIYQVNRQSRFVYHFASRKYPDVNQRGRLVNMHTKVPVSAGTNLYKRVCSLTEDLI